MVQDIAQVYRFAITAKLFHIKIIQLSSLLNFHLQDILGDEVDKEEF